MVCKKFFTTVKIITYLFTLIHFQDRFIKYFHLRGRSSGVERNLAKVEVEGSNPFARSRILPILFIKIICAPITRQLVYKILIIIQN